MPYSNEHSINSTALSFYSVSKCYGKSHFPFNKLDLKIHHREKILLTGINGAGKTSVLKLAAGYLEPSSGMIRVYGQPIKNQKKKIGLMLQHHFLYWDLTTKENLEFSAYLYGQCQVESNIAAATETWGLAPFLSKKVGQLSNGQKTLLALARANIHFPELLLLDEPHVYLDDSHLRRLESFLLQSNQTILLTSQSPTLLRNVTNRVVSL